MQGNFIGCLILLSPPPPFYLEQFQVLKGFIADVLNRQILKEIIRERKVETFSLNNKEKFACLVLSFK